MTSLISRGLGSGVPSVDVVRTPLSCVWLELRRRQTQERLLGAAPVFTARREIIVVAADVAGQEIRIVHLREKKIDVFRAELDRAL